MHRSRSVTPTIYIRLVRWALILTPLILLSGCHVASAPALIISEFMAVPKSTLSGFSEKNSDWIEIYNPTATPVSLANWYLTDDSSLLDKWQFPPITIAPYSYQLVMASGLDKVEPELHTNFSLNANGEFLALVKPNKQIAHAYAPTPQYTDISFGIGPQGTGYFKTPTPGGKNSSSHMPKNTEVVFSHSSGFYNAPFLLTLHTSIPNATIHYTTDNSWPTETHGELYTEPILLDDSIVIKAVAFITTAIPHTVDTHTFIFEEGVLTQSNTPVGFPKTWKSNGLPADYEMDPEIVSGNEQHLLAGFNALPIVTLSFESADLFESNVLYANPRHRGSESERRVAFEYIDHENDIYYNANLGGRIHGNGSRTPSWSPKHSFRLNAKARYGAKSVPNLFFDTSQANTFSELVLRAHFNDSWVQPAMAMHPKTAQYMRDTFMRDTFREMGYSTPDSQPVHLFLNGLYWGIYELAERPKIEYASNNLAINPNEWSVQSSTPTDVSDAVYEPWAALDQLVQQFAKTQDPSLYAEIEARIDLVNLADFMLINHWAGNQDFHDGNHIVIFPLAPETGKIQFSLWDSETIFANQEIWGSTNFKDSTPSGWHKLLLASPTYQTLYKDRAYLHLMDGGALNPTRTTSRYHYLTRTIAPAIWNESARWGDYRRDINTAGGPYNLYTYETWETQRDYIISEVLLSRTNTFLTDLAKNQFEYELFAPPEVVIHGDQGQLISYHDSAEIYYTLDGSDPRLPDSTVNPSATQGNSFSFSGPTVLSVRSKLGTDWSAIHRQTLHTNSIGFLQFSEIHYNPAIQSDLTEYFVLENKSQQAVDLSGYTISGDISHYFSRGTVLPPQGRLVLARNPLALSINCEHLAADDGYEMRLSNASGKIKLTNPNGVVITEASYGNFNNLALQQTDGKGAVLIRKPDTFHLSSTDPSIWTTKPFCSAAQAVNNSPPFYSQQIGVTSSQLGSPARHFSGATGHLSDFGKVVGYRVYADAAQDWLWVDILIQSLATPDRADYFLFIEGRTDTYSVKANSPTWATEAWPTAGKFVTIGVPVHLPHNATPGPLPISLHFFSNQDGSHYLPLTNGNGEAVDRIALGTLWLTPAMIERATLSE